MSRADIPSLDTIGDAAVLAPNVRRTARETWFDPDWLWNFCKGMHDAGVPTERILAALDRQYQVHRLPFAKRLLRRVHLKAVRGYWDY